jgi:hypothetical protein
VSSQIPETPPTAAPVKADTNALGELMGFGWSAVVVAVLFLWGIIAAVLAAAGRKELKAIKGLPRTAETLQEIPPTLKPNA